MDKKKIDLKELGYLYSVNSGFQFDLNTVLLKTREGFSEGHLCDHNCSQEYGNYSCPAAFSRNHNSHPESVMSYAEIVQALVFAKKGLLEMNKVFLEQIFPKYVSKYKIPEDIAFDIKQTLAHGTQELNLFGGNPEMHPQFLRIIKSAKKMGWKVTATTTGKQFFNNQNFLNKFLACPPHLLAMSADDYEDIDELKALLSYSLIKIKILWQKANPLYGQRKKAYESIYVAKLSQNLKNFCPLLFNIVVHPGNISHINELVQLLSSSFPKAIINPYLGQSSFLRELPIWGKKHLSLLQKFIDFMIATQLKQKDNKNKRFVPRIHYWLMLKSIFLVESNKEKLLQYCSGYGVWQCYKVAGAGRYLQVSSAVKTRKSLFRAGGHPGCFWNNQTVTDAKRQLWNMNPQEVALFLLLDRHRLAKNSVKPCPGCIMPRLLFDGISTELGMAEKLLPTYLKLRQKYLNF